MTAHLLRYRLVALYRGLVRQAFALFLIGPILVGAALWILARYLDLMRAFLAERAIGGPGELAGPLALVLALVATALLAPAARRELYSLAPATALVEALPVPPAPRFRATFAAVAAAGLPLMVAILLVAVFLHEGPPPAMRLALWTLRAAAVVLTTTPLVLAAVLALVHLRLRGVALAAAAVAGPALAVAGAASGHPLGELLLLPWWASAAQLEAVLASALAVPVAPRAAAAPWFLLVTLAVAAAGVRVLHRRWQRRDLETARALARRGSRRRRGATLVASGRRRLGGPVAVQVGRDLLLVLRRFSPAVHLAAAASVLAWTALLVALPAAPAWRVPLAVFLAVLAVYPPAALVPFLLRHELRSGWLERSSGVDPETVWKAKLWTARLLALPAAAVSAAALTAVLAPVSGEALGIGLLQLAAGAWIVASFLGVGVFETAEQPLLGLLFASLAGLALAALLVFVPRAAWMWLVLFVFGQGAVASRATRRVELLGTGI